MQVDDPGKSSPGPAPAPSLESPPSPPAPSGSPGAEPGATPPEAAPAGAPGAATSPGSSDGVPIRIDVQPPREDEPAWTQEALAAEAHVTFSGTVRCEACAAPLVLRALPFQPPDELTLGRPPSPLTALPLSGPGEFTLRVPRGDRAVVLELLVDLDGDGAPDRGERMSVVVRDGQLVPDQDRGGFLIDASEATSGAWPAMGPENASGEH